MAEGKPERPEVIAGISNVVPEESEPGDYAGISFNHTQWGVYTGDDHAEFQRRIRDLPSALEQYENHPDDRVKHWVMKDYAKWKMMSDCWQPPHELAMFLRYAITKHEFYIRLHDGLMGRLL